MNNDVPTCEDDPCYCDDSTSADFAVLEGQRNDGLGLGLLVEVPDSVMTGNTIFLRAAADNASYNWLVDSVSYSRRQISIPKSLTPKSMSVRLIVVKDSGYYCYEQDDGIDTSYRQIQIVSWKDWPLNGTYMGSWDIDQTDTFQINISADTNVVDPGNWEYLTLENLDKNACSIFYCCSNARLYFNYFDYNDNIVTCRSRTGEAHRANHDSLSFRYEYIPNLSDLSSAYDVVFSGKKP